MTSNSQFFSDFIYSKYVLLKCHVAPDAQNCGFSSHTTINTIRQMLKSLISPFLLSRPWVLIALHPRPPPPLPSCSVLTSTQNICQEQKNNSEEWVILLLVLSPPSNYQKLSLILFLFVLSMAASCFWPKLFHDERESVYFILIKMYFPE